jgi:hypothetical protein
MHKVELRGAMVQGVLQTLMVSQLIKKCPAFYGIRIFIVEPTRAHH